MTTESNDLTRRGFNAVALGAGAAATVGGSASAALAVTETDVTIKTPDGTCDAAFIHPTTGSYPGVLIWADAFGLRPSFRDMAKRLAAEGYAVLVPNPYYRNSKAPGIRMDIDFGKAEDRAELGKVMGPVTADGAAERDAIAYVAWMDNQPQVKKTAKIGTQGYCMGGPLTMRTAATIPDRIGAAGSFHGGGLVTDKPNSPHLLVPKIKAAYYFGVAESDDKTDPKAKDVLKAAFADAKKPAMVEVYAGSIHGWCVPDMPARDGMPIYNKPLAEKAWTNLLGLYKTALV